jgi:hypothetical protein
MYPDKCYITETTHDSAACPPGYLPWSSIDFSASPEVVDASFLMFTSQM